MYGDFACTAIPYSAPAVPLPEKWDANSITYLVAVQNELKLLHRNMPMILPYVDRAIVVETGSTDGSAEYLASLAPKVAVVPPENRVAVVAAEYYNVALQNVLGGWVLVLGNQALPSQELLENLRGLIEASEGGTKFDTVEFKVPAGGDASYYKSLYRWYPGMQYTPTGLVGPKGPTARCDHTLHVSR